MIKGNNENFTWVEVDDIIIAMQTNYDMKGGEIEYDYCSYRNFDSFIRGEYSNNMFEEILFFDKNTKIEFDAFDCYAAIEKIKITEKDGKTLVLVDYEDAWASECTSYFTVKDVRKFIEALKYIYEQRFSNLTYKEIDNEITFIYS